MEAEPRGGQSWRRGCGFPEAWNVCVTAGPSWGRAAGPRQEPPAAREQTRLGPGRGPAGEQNAESLVPSTWRSRGTQKTEHASHTQRGGAGRPRARLRRWGGAGTKSRLITSLNTRVILYITPCLSSPAPAPLRHLSFLLVLSDRASTRLRPEPSSHSAVWEDAGAVGALPGEGSPA